MYARTQARRASRWWWTGRCATGGGSRLRAPAAVAAVLVVLTSVGCRPTGPISEPTPTASPSPSLATRVPDEADLRSVLLTVADLPRGYRLRDSRPSAEPTPSLETSDPECAKLIAGPEPEVGYAGEPPAKVKVLFEKGEAGAAVGQALVSHRDQATLVQGIDRFREVVSRCGEFVGTVDDVVLKVRMTSASFPALGDETFAIKLNFIGTGTGRGIRFGGYFVLTRVANTVNMIYHAGMPGVDAAETRRITTRAVDKLAPLARQPA